MSVPVLRYAAALLLAVGSLGSVYGATASASKGETPEVQPFECQEDALENMVGGAATAPSELKGWLIAGGFAEGCGDEVLRTVVDNPPLPAREGLVTYAKAHPGAWETLCPGLKPEAAGRKDLSRCAFDAVGLDAADAHAFFLANRTPEDQDSAAQRAMLLGMVVARLQATPAATARQKEALGQMMLERVSAPYIDGNFNADQVPGYPISVLTPQVSVSALESYQPPTDRWAGSSRAPQRRSRVPGADSPEKSGTAPLLAPGGFEGGDSEYVRRSLHPLLAHCYWDTYRDVVERPEVTLKLSVYFLDTSDLGPVIPSDPDSDDAFVSCVMRWSRRFPNPEIPTTRASLNPAFAAEATAVVGPLLPAP